MHSLAHRDPYMSQHIGPNYRMPKPDVEWNLDFMTIMEWNLYFFNEQHVTGTNQLFWNQ